MNDNLNELAFEKALSALEQIVKQLEEGSLSLEESLKLFEHGQRLAAHCNHLLETATLRVERLTADGEIVDISP